MSAVSPPQSIPYLNDLKIDGNSLDWPDSYAPIRILSDVYGETPDSSDFYARFRLAWDENSLYVLAEVWDDSLYEDPSKFWNGDGLEIFVSPNTGSFDIVQVSVRPSYDLPGSLAAVAHYDHRRTDSLRSITPGSVFCSHKLTGSFLIEGRIPLDMLGVRPALGNEMAIQIYINDSDEEGDSMNFSLPWYPVRESYRNPYAFNRVRFSEAGTPVIIPEVRTHIRDDETVFITVLSDQSGMRQGLKVVSDNLTENFSLKPEQNGLYIHRWELPLKKFLPGKNSLHFMYRDSLYSNIHLCMAPRLYETIPKPNRFEDEIRIFEIIDNFKPPPENALLFTGSSTIRKWYDIDKYLPGFMVINRGFGGSTMNDLNHYLDRIVIPYKPARIFVYEGDNDIARGVSPTKFIEECRKFISACSKDIPNAEIYFISIKPSLARKGSWDKMQEANIMLEDLSKRHEQVHYIDISQNMMNADGTPKSDIFEPDRLHLNKKGYEILYKEIQSILYQ
ncbi:sugar-binding protein [Bacteroidota bacterium]